MKTKGLHLGVDGLFYPVGQDFNIEESDVVFLFNREGVSYVVKDYLNGTQVKCEFDLSVEGEECLVEVHSTPAGTLDIPVQAPVETPTPVKEEGVLGSGESVPAQTTPGDQVAQAFPLSVTEGKTSGPKSHIMWNGNVYGNGHGGTRAAVVRGEGIIRNLTTNPGWMDTVHSPGDDPWKSVRIPKGLPTLPRNVLMDLGIRLLDNKVK